MNIWFLIFLSHIPRRQFKLPPSFHTGMDINHTWKCTYSSRRKIISKTNVKTGGNSVAISTEHLQYFNNSKNEKFVKETFSTLSFWKDRHASACMFLVFLAALWIELVTLSFWTNFYCVLSLSLFNYVLNQLKAQIIVFHYCGEKSCHSHVFRIVVFL